MEQKNRNFLFKFFRDKNLDLYNSAVKNPAYLDLNTFFPEHVVLEKNWKEIKKEIESVINSKKELPKFHEVDDGQEYISDNDGIEWSLFNLKVYDMWHKENKSMCPKTSLILSSMKNVKSAYFSILAPGKHIPPHKGPYKGILRYQLALTVPKSGECKLLVDNIPYFWKEGESVLFDDTYTHEVQNKTEEKRIALLLDVKRSFPNVFMKIYDGLIFKLIQLLVVLNNTFKKSSVK
tara:strand:+ start:704 stop:1408 length:705 start_codon:yes stop_codon:yes gene_type:complete